MRIDRQPAYILHERPYRETSVLLEALTRDHGRVGLVARGVRTARPRLQRGTLAPLVALEIGWQGRGELGTLTAAEAVGPPPGLVDTALFCALYVNELLTRIVQRNDPHPQLFVRYAQCLRELADPALAQAWVLRRFERDLLEILGDAMLLDREGTSGEALLDEGIYSYDPELGPVAWAARPLAPRVSGRALLALDREELPDARALAELRTLMRAVFRHHLGGRELNAWLMSPPATPRPAPAPGTY